jgi:hypothetical protein
MRRFEVFVPSIVAFLSERFCDLLLKDDVRELHGPEVTDGLLLGLGKDAKVLVELKKLVLVLRNTDCLTILRGMIAVMISYHRMVQVLIGSTVS